MTGEPTTLASQPARADCWAAASASAEGLHPNSLKASFVIVELTLNLSRSPSLILLAVYEEAPFTVGWMPGSNSQEDPDRSFFFVVVITLSAALLLPLLSGLPVLQLQSPHVELL